MALNIHNLIAAINPDIYCDSEKKEEVKNKFKETKSYAEASKVAKPKDSLFMDFDELYYKSAFDTPGIKNPIEKHALVYDSFSENLEPAYFWILDNMENSKMKTFKLIDNFISSPGSGHFSEMGGKATKMQEEGMKMLGAANQVVKSILNILYDLKEFEMRLELYDKYNKSKTPAEKGSALLSLKQVWMDTVDLKRGTTSLKGLVQQLNYVTIIDAFMAANSVEDVTKTVEKGGLDLNDRVRRILQQRTGEFFGWISESEKELRRRYEIEKNYLRSQVNTVKLYARWAKPYLKAARALEQNAAPSASLVTSFNTVIFELAILGEGEYKPEDDVEKGDLPEMFKKRKARKYSPVIIVELKFRSVPERAGQQGYGFRGKVDLAFTSYALNSEELEVLRKEIDKDDVDDVFKLIEGSTTQSLEQIKEELDPYLGEEKKEKDKKDEKKDEDSNPFSAMFSFFKGDKKDKQDGPFESLFSFFRGKKEKKEGEITPDSDMEKVIRSKAIIKAREDCRKLYDNYKKAHSMPAF